MTTLRELTDEEVEALSRSAYEYEYRFQIPFTEITWEKESPETRERWRERTRFLTERHLGLLDGSEIVRDGKVVR